MARRRKNSNLVAARARMYRELIFAAAERAFAEHGFEGATMQDIAAEAGISLKTLYATFEGKREIYEEIRQLRSREFVAVAVASLREGGPILERMARGIRAYVEFILQHRHFFRLQLREGRSWGLTPPDDTGGDWRTGLQLQAALLREGMEAGIFYTGDPELTAATSIAIMQVQLAGLLGGTDTPDTEAIGRQILDALHRYLVKPEAAAAGERDSRPPARASA
jgi:AcrR family transcriptional regulator